MSLNNQMSRHTGTILERQKFEQWAKKQEYDTAKFVTNLDFSGMPAYKCERTYDAWAGWMGHAKFFDGE